MNPVLSRLQPVFDPRPWGALSLAPLFPEMSGLKERIGEAWLSGSECLFVNGPFAGKKLGPAWKQMGPDWRGTNLRQEKSIPLLVKFLFPQQKLSVQVHPGDEDARNLEPTANGRGKTEMWYVVSAEAGAQVLAGLRRGVTAESFQRAIANGTAEDCLQPIPLQQGDTVFVPAGTAHTIGPGLVLCEIQQHSDITYRVYDYNRRDPQGKTRPLHIEKAVQVMNFGDQKAGKTQPLRLDCAGVVRTHLAACRYFATEKWEFAGMARGATSPEHFELLIFVEGRGEIRARGERLPFQLAEPWLLPATLGEYEVHSAGRVALLRTYVPSSLDDLVRQLTEGASPSACAGLVFR